MQLGLFFVGGGIAPLAFRRFAPEKMILLKKSLIKNFFSRYPFIFPQISRNGWLFLVIYSAFGSF